jgi:hypothetical protein
MLDDLQEVAQALFNDSAFFVTQASEPGETARRTARCPPLP